jgi:hypothetical protein
MNTKPNLGSIVLAVLLITTACSPNTISSPILDQAPLERSYKSDLILPVTSGQSYEEDQRAYDFEQEARAYPSRQFHSACVSDDIHRQAKCEEKEQNGATLLSGKGNTEAPAHPLQKIHSACVFADLQRQENCVE